MNIEQYQDPVYDVQHIVYITYKYITQIFDEKRGKLRSRTVGKCHCYILYCLRNV